MKSTLIFLFFIFTQIAGAATPALSLDYSKSYSAEVETLPLYPKTKNGLTRIQVGQYTFKARLWGMRNSGPALVLLHGFPGSSIMWKPLAREAARRGYKVLAFDMRGYSPGARPQSAKLYRVDYFIEDLLHISNRLGFQKFHLVGHDIGCVVSWGTAMIRPNRLHSMSCLSIPNPDVLQLRTYIRLFSIPKLPEAALRFNGSAQFLKLLPYNRSPQEDADYRAIFSEPGSLTAALNFYRSIYQSQSVLKNHYSTLIEVPTLFIYGENEGWVQPEVLQAQAQRMKPGTPLKVVEIGDAGPSGHFLMETQPILVTTEILKHIAD